MNNKPQSKASRTEQSNIRRKEGPSPVSGSPSSDYTIRINKAEIEINSIWYNVKEAEVRIGKEGIKINKGTLKKA